MRRDVVIIKKNDLKSIVIATDFAQCIGNLSNDQLKIPFETVLHFTLRSVIAEIISIGSIPFMLTFSNSFGDEGYKHIEKAVEEIRDELLLDSLDFLVSTEKNFCPLETALSITCMGESNNGTFRIKTPKSAILGIIGEPLVGQEVLNNELLSLKKLSELLSIEGVHEILPVGSKGINHELKYFTDKKWSDSLYDGKKSAGPSTCFIISYEDSSEENIKKQCNQPFERIR